MTLGLIKKFDSKKERLKKSTTSNTNKSILFNL